MTTDTAERRATTTRRRATDDAALYADLAAEYERAVAGLPPLTAIAYLAELIAECDELAGDRAAMALSAFAYEGMPPSQAHRLMGVSRDRFATLRKNTAGGHSRELVAQVVPRIPDAAARLERLAADTEHLNERRRAATRIRDRIIYAIPVAEFDRLAVAEAAQVTPGRVSQIRATHGRRNGSMWGARMAAQPPVPGLPPLVDDDMKGGT